MKNFLLNNKFALLIACFAALVYIWTLLWGGQLCNCSSVDSVKNTTNRSVHGFYYHK